MRISDWVQTCALPIGQSLRAKSDDTFAAGSGLSDQWSDYVARLTVSPGRYFSLVDRVRVSQNEDLTVQRHEATATLGSSLTRSEEHTSELQSLMRISYAVFCLKKKKKTTH